MKHKTIIIGIAGPSASGKTLLANTLVKELHSERVIVIGEDAYYKKFDHLPLEERMKINFDHPDAFDHDLLTHHLRLLKRGKPVKIPIYDFATYTRLDQTTEIKNRTIVILEGILLFAEPELRDQLDIRIFMDTPLDICFIRRLERDIRERGRKLESVLQQYQKTVRPMYFQFIEPSKRYADIIVPHGGENRIAIDVIKAKLRELLTDNS